MKNLKAVNFDIHSTPIGEILLAAGLISEAQLYDALNQQNQPDQNMRLGKILALQGFIQQQTADFFAEHFKAIVKQEDKLPIGQYFYQAGLLESQQVKLVLQDQAVNHMRFGTTAVLKGYISQKTLDFFLNHLYAERSCMNRNWRANPNRWLNSRVNQKASPSIFKEATSCDETTLFKETKVYNTKIATYIQQITNDQVTRPNHYQIEHDQVNALALKWMIENGLVS